MGTNNFNSVFFIFILLISIFINSCSTTRQSNYNDGPPILFQDELARPYTKLGRIRVSREVFGSDYSLTPEIKAWGLSAIRQEAEKMGADAVILPEVTGHTTSYGIIPSTEYIATGFAIRFK